MVNEQALKQCSKATKTVFKRWSFTKIQAVHEDSKGFGITERGCSKHDITVKQAQRIKDAYWEYMDQVEALEEKGS